MNLFSWLAPFLVIFTAAFIGTFGGFWVSVVCIVIISPLCLTWRGISEEKTIPKLSIKEEEKTKVELPPLIHIRMKHYLEENQALKEELSQEKENVRKKTMENQTLQKEIKIYQEKLKNHYELRTTVELSRQELKELKDIIKISNEEKEASRRLWNRVTDYQRGTTTTSSELNQAVEHAQKLRPITHAEQQMQKLMKRSCIEEVDCA